jgi:hypothetical protein
MLILHVCHVHASKALCLIEVSLTIYVRICTISNPYKILMKDIDTCYHWQSMCVAGYPSLRPDHDSHVPMTSCDHRKSSHTICDGCIQSTLHICTLKDGEVRVDTCSVSFNEGFSWERSAVWLSQPTPPASFPSNVSVIGFIWELVR